MMDSHTIYEYLRVVRMYSANDIHTRTYECTCTSMHYCVVFVSMGTINIYSAVYSLLAYCTNK